VDDLFAGPLTQAVIRVNHAVSDALVAGTPVALDPDGLAVLLSQLASAAAESPDGPAAQHILTLARALEEIPQ
jgi:hypothetical protein